MPLGYRGDYFRPEPPSTGRVTKHLIFITMGAYILQLLLVRSSPMAIAALGLRADWAFKGAVWQFVTYMFLHGGILHLIFNMLVLWWFGTIVEGSFGRTRFLEVYFGAGVFGGLVQALVNFVWGPQNALVLGCSGGILGLLVVCAFIVPHMTVFLSFIIPVKMRTMVMLFIFLDLCMALRHERTETAVWAHLGGAGFGFFYYRVLYKRGIMLTGFWRDLRRKLASMGGSGADVSDKEVDRILLKIGRDGIQSLTRRERKILMRASKQKKK